ncbi:MAG: hypothetical protein QOE31_226 [Solirubrobacteraceae bacterium]|nr:hypothetical protein [Solirubrobacteraceae bacterium]
MSRHAIIALLMAGAGAIGLIFTLTSHSSVRDDIAKSYRKVGEEKAPGRDAPDRKPTLIYASPKSVTRTASDIIDKHKPADRRTTEAGAFLRYSDDIVSVVPPPKGSTGSRILVDDEEGGYHRNFFFVGGFWGTYSGPAGSFRGGGPGTGK